MEPSHQRCPHFAVTDGLVTLTGHLTTFAEKHSVERAVRRVAGVRGIAIDLDVKLAPQHKRSDAGIAEAAILAMRWHSLVRDERVKVEVENGRVTLTGELDWGFQYASVEQGTQPLLGVRGVTNLINIKPRVSAKDLGAQITGALTRQAQREAHHIGVEVDGGIVTLSGKVLRWRSMTPPSARRPRRAAYRGWWTTCTSVPDRRKPRRSGAAQLVRVGRQ